MSSPTHRVTKSVYADGRTVTDNKTYTGSANQSLEETISAGASDVAITFAIDVSAVKSMIVSSDQDLFLETNNADSGLADSTISLVADVPYVWTEDSYFTNVFDADVTTIYATNNGASDATLKIEVLTDATP